MLLIKVIFSSIHLEDLQKRIFLLIRKFFWKEGYKDFSNVKLLYCVHVLTFEWTDYFLFALFHENAFEQKNFIDGIQICLEEDSFSFFIFS